MHQIICHFWLVEIQRGRLAKIIHYSLHLRGHRSSVYDTPARRDIDKGFQSLAYD